jgi:hypothetical protein
MSAGNLKQKAYQEIKEYLVMSGYLWVVFSLFALYRSVILADDSGSAIEHGFALINALALAKVMLIAKEFHVAERFKEEPLIYATLFKSAAFAVVLGFFKILEATLVGWYHGHSLTDSLAEVTRGGPILRGILVLVFLLGFLLIPFFAFAELGDALGENKLSRLFLKSRHS